MGTSVGTGQALGTLRCPERIQKNKSTVVEDSINRTKRKDNLLVCYTISTVCNFFFSHNRAVLGDNCIVLEGSRCDKGPILWSPLRYPLDPCHPPSLGD